MKNFVPQGEKVWKFNPSIMFQNITGKNKLGKMYYSIGKIKCEVCKIKQRFFPGFEQQN